MPHCKRRHQRATREGASRHLRSSRAGTVRFNHAAVGAAIVVEWQFQDVVTDAIARHHDSDLGTSTPVLDAVVIANMVAKNIGMGPGAKGFNLSVDSEFVRRLGLDFTRFARVCLQTDTWLRELRAQASPMRKTTALHG